MGAQLEVLRRAMWTLVQNSGFSMAGAIAFSFLLSLFPFCIFLGALAGTIGGRDLARYAVTQLFDAVPEAVAKALAPEVERVMGQSQYGLLTIGAAVSLFFATSAVETLRAALNVAYRVTEMRSYLWCVAQSSLFVFATAAGMLVMAWGVVVGPALAANSQSAALHWLLDHGLFSPPSRYTIVVAVTLAQLFAYHMWLAAGRRSINEIWPGVLLSVGLWILAAAVYSSWLTVSDYTKFYAGLTQLLSALIFFQVTGMIMILGAEFNRALSEARASG
ncbi:MAG: YihY/virulence factor BrkB family protein [Hyphomicrobiaceae bacterium]